MKKVNLIYVIMMGLITVGLFGGNVSKAETLTADHVQALQKQRQKHWESLSFFIHGRSDRTLIMFDKKATIAGLARRAREITEFLEGHAIGSEVDAKKLRKMIPDFQSFSPASSTLVSTRSDSEKGSQASSSSLNAEASSAAVSALDGSVEDGDEAIFVLRRWSGAMPTKDFLKKREEDMPERELK